MRLYLDTCCVNRPFDDQAQERVRVESEAVLSIIQRFQTGSDQWIGSDVLLEEIDAIRDLQRRDALRTMALEVDETVTSDGATKDRSKELMSLGFAEMDAHHLAVAEQGSADAFITVDDKLLRRAGRLKARLAVKVVTPVSWIVEQLR
jgi:predicted nucleic acid-binding protein